MFVRRCGIPLVLALCVTGGWGCADGIGPQPATVQPPLFSVAPSYPAAHLLQQAPTAPPLGTYQVSFWADWGKESRVRVNYQPAAGEKVGRPFLYFNIPKEGLVAVGGVLLQKGDSVFITMSIDPVSFAVDFGPSGLRFSAESPATLVMCYENMNPDLNGDGVVDAADQTLQEQISFWYQSVKADSWVKLPTMYDSENPCVATPLYHFSQYGVAW